MPRRAPRRCIDEPWILPSPYAFLSPSASAQFIRPQANAPQAAHSSGTTSICHASAGVPTEAAGWSVDAYVLYSIVARLR